MRMITAAQNKLIKATLAEGMRDFPLGGLLEKDIHVTEALQALARIEHPYVELVFCGGTCLAKAHRLIQRMSEDVDLKIVLDPAHGLSNDRLRQHLSTLKARIADAMEGLGFVAVEGSQRARNQNRYFCSDWHYEPLLSTHYSLRPYLRLECIVRTPLAPTTLLPIGYLHDHLLDRHAEAPCMSCISIQETLAEKILSFLRRHAEHRAGITQRAWDGALVRHIYDVSCIVCADPNAVDRACEHFPELVDFETREFSRHTAFCENPGACLAHALEVAGAEAQTQSEYRSRVMPLVYGKTKPPFRTAFGAFQASATRLLATL